MVVLPFPAASFFLLLFLMPVLRLHTQSPWFQRILPLLSCPHFLDSWGLTPCLHFLLTTLGAYLHDTSMWCQANNFLNTGRPDQCLFSLYCHGNQGSRRSFHRNSWFVLSLGTLRQARFFSPIGDLIILLDWSSLKSNNFTRILSLS